MQRNYYRIALAVVAVASLVGCADSDLGPLSDKAMQTVTDDRGQIVVKTLRDKVLEQGVPAKAWDNAADYFDANKSIIRNRKWLSIIDFSKFSGERRLFVINLADGEVGHLHVAHGVGSDPNHTGYAGQFSNEDNSHMSSLGFYLVAEPYTGKWGLSARLDGLDSSNSRARQRAIVMHGASYVSPDLPKMGRTWGCPAVDPAEIDILVNRLKGDSLLYAYTEGM
jgi:hypothetical protein